jgi:2-methylisocitrate lyase-like PEP mutase family enzyme
LRQRLSCEEPLIAPGVYDAMSALLVERAGFDAAYLSGASIAYTQLGRPDVGLVSFDQVADAVRRICERIAIPLLVDADTGWGGVLNVHRIVRMFERAGASAIQLEDQSFPKRCGHLDGKEVILAEEMADKLKAACDARVSRETLIVARTDARGVHGLGEALDRAELYIEAGADVMFVEALLSHEELRLSSERLGDRVPLVANMVEGGRTPLLSASEAKAIGYKIILAPGSLVRILVPTVQAFLQSLHDDGSTAAWRDHMLDLNGVNAVLGTSELLESIGGSGRTSDVTEARNRPTDEA